jgi:hypothetical protein
MGRTFVIPARQHDQLPGGSSVRAAHDRRVDQRDAAGQEGGYLLECLRADGGGLDQGGARSQLPGDTVYDLPHRGWIGEHGDDHVGFTNRLGRTRRYVGALRLERLGAGRRAVPDRRG